MDGDAGAPPCSQEELGHRVRGRANTRLVFRDEKSRVAVHDGEQVAAAATLAARVVFLGCRVLRWGRLDDGIIGKFHGPKAGAARAVRDMQSMSCWGVDDFVAAAHLKQPPSRYQCIHTRSGWKPLGWQLPFLGRKPLGSLRGDPAACQPEGFQFLGGDLGGCLLQQRRGCPSILTKRPGAPEPPLQMPLKCPGRPVGTEGGEGDFAPLVVASRQAQQLRLEFIESGLKGAWKALGIRQVEWLPTTGRNRSVRACRKRFGQWN